MTKTNQQQKEDDVLRKMLSTPPKPHEFGKESKGEKKPKND